MIAADLEGTLTTGETWRGVGRYVVGVLGHRAEYALFIVTHYPVAYLAKFGLVDRQRFKDRWLADLVGLLRGLSAQELAHMARWVVDHELWPGRRIGVLAELEAKVREGKRVILASGTLEPLLEEFARRLGAEAIGTPLEVKDGRVTGRILGNNSGARKAERLRERIGAEPVEAAYGDTESDLPMLELAAAPVAVHPEARLRAVALSRGWRILE